MTRPTCLSCGKPLQKATRIFHKESLDDDDPTHFEYRRIVEITSRHPGYSGQKVTGEFLRVWTGGYGVRGNGKFCTIKCGYKYALIVTSGEVK